MSSIVTAGSSIVNAQTGAGVTHAADPAVTELEAPTIVTGDGYRYTLTGHDLLTLARSIHREGPSDAPEILWTYAQRMAMLGDRFSSLASLVTAHSQPINPIWFPDGRMCRPGGEYAGTDSCANAASRPANAVRPWAQINPSVRAAIIAWTRGELPNPVPRAVDFAEDDLLRRKMAGSNPEGFAVVRDAANTFVSTTRSRAWPSDRFVRLEASGRTVSVKGLSTGTKLAIGLGALALLGGGLYVAQRKGYVKVPKFRRRQDR